MAAQGRQAVPWERDTALSLQEEISRYMAAAGHLTELLDGARALVLLQAAVRHGIVDLLRTRQPEANLAETAGIEPRILHTFLIALEAYDIVDRHDDRVQLRDPYLLLTDPRALRSLAVSVASTAAECRLLDAVLDAVNQPSISSADAIALADGVTYNPTSPLALALMAAIYDEMPDARDRLAAGGAYLELGCGVGSGLLSMLQIFPTCTAVGIERQPPVADALRHRAEQLGVAERVEVHTMDALDLTDIERFDVAYWSYGFFPLDTHAAALAVAHRALRLGGWLWLGMPQRHHDEVQAKTDARVREAVMLRLLEAHTGFSGMSVDHLIAELTEAGFASIQALDQSRYPIITARRR